MPSESPVLNIQTEELSFGTIFQYPNQLAENQFKNWASELGYSFGDSADGLAISNGPEGMQIRGGNKTIGKRENGFQVVYNDTANIIGFGDCSFVTYGRFSV